MADELDDRLRDLARDAEPLIVLAGPQAARTRGERRRARRRAAAAGVTAVLALAVGGWQLLPLGDARPGGAVAGSAGTVTGAPDPVPSSLQSRLGTELLPADALPYGGKWQWVAVTPEKAAAKFPPPCNAVPPAGASAQAARTYLSERTSAVANYRLLAYGDTKAAAAQLLALRERLKKECGIALPTKADAPPPDGMSMLSAATSKWQPGVTVWVEGRGRYVAVLFLTVPGDPQGKSQDSGVEGCITASLERLTYPPSDAATGGTAVGRGTGTGDAKDRTTGSGDAHSTGPC